MRKATYFISDLHLGAAYDKDSRQRERHVVEFLDSIKEDAGAIFLLGDILDYWYEYKYVVPKGHVRLFGKLAELSDSGVRITWLTGNHDIWIFDYLPEELGITVVDSELRTEIDGIDFFLAHGDRTGCDSMFFRIMQRLFRNRVCQSLFAAINPRWTVPFAFRWSASSRQKPQLYGDDRRSDEALDRLSEYCDSYLKVNPGIKYFIFGHLHILARRKLAEDAEILVIGDWLSHYSYARFADGVLSVNTFQLN